MAQKRVSLNEDLAERVYYLLKDHYRCLCVKAGKTRSEGARAGYFAEARSLDLILMELNNQINMIKLGRSVWNAPGLGTATKTKGER